MASVSLDDVLAAQKQPEQQGGGGQSIPLETVHQQLPGATPPQRPESWSEYASGLAGAVSSGATFGFADELKGAVQGGLAKLRGEDYGPAYEKARDEARQEHKDFAARHPWQSGAAELYGGGGAALMGGEIPTVSRATQLAGRLLPDAAPAAVQWAARTAVPAAAGGAVQGFGEGEGGLGDRALSAAKGAGVGAVAGPALSGVAQGVTNLAGGVGRAIGMGDAGTLADNLILRNLKRDNMPVDELRTAAGAGAEPNILPDFGGRNTQQLAGSAANMPGKPMEAADNLVQSRRLSGPDRMAASSDAAFGGGSGGDVATAADTLIKQRSAEAGPLYDKAFAAQVADNPDLKRMLGMPEIQKGIQQGLDIQRIEAGATGAPRTYSGPELLDAGKRGLDVMLEKYRDKTTGRLVLDDQGRALEGLRKSFVAATDQAVPELAAARQAWAGPSSALDAMGRGRRALSNDRDIVEAANQRLSPADADFYRLGAGRSVSDRMSDPAGVPGQARKLLEDRQMQARLDTLIPDPAQRQAFNDALQREVRMADTNRVISPRAGSPTARNEAGMEDIGAGGQVAAEAMQGFAKGGLIPGVTRGYNALMERSKGLRSDVGEALADRLFTTDPANIQATIERLASNEQTRALSEQLRRELAQRLMVTTGQSAAHLAH